MEGNGSGLGPRGARQRCSGSRTSRRATIAYQAGPSGWAVAEANRTRCLRDSHGGWTRLSRGGHGRRYCRGAAHGGAAGDETRHPERSEGAGRLGRGEHRMSSHASADLAPLSGLTRKRRSEARAMRFSQTKDASGVVEVVLCDLEGRVGDRRQTQEPKDWCADRGLWTGWKRRLLIDFLATGKSIVGTRRPGVVSRRSARRRRLRCRASTRNLRSMSSSKARHALRTSPRRPSRP